MDHSTATATAVFPMQAEQPWALVYCCIDFRFHRKIKKFVQNHLGIKDFDLKTDAGSVKQLNAQESPIAEWVIKNFQIAIEHHKVPEIILFAHSDCAAYGGNSAFSDFGQQIGFLKKETSQAMSHVQSQCPDIKVQGFVAALENGQIHMLPVTV